MLRQQPALQIEAEHASNAYIVRLEGELDLAGCSALERALVDSEQSPAEQIFLDLEQLTFMDASGLNVLLQAEHRSAQNGHRLHVTRGHGQVADLFRLTAVNGSLPFTDYIPEGARTASPPVAIPNGVVHAFAEGH